MSSISNTLDRASVGAPVTQRALTMVPLILDGAGNPTDYVPLGHAVSEGRTKLTEVSDSGSVPLLAIKNDADVAVLIIDGEELLGAKQNRIVNLSILVPARTVLPIPVSCVERGRWSYRTRGFDVSPNAMFAGGRAGNMEAVTMCMTAFGRRDGDQARVWDDVDERLHKCGARSSTRAMKDIYDDQYLSIDSLVREMTPRPDQAGAVFAIGGRVVGMELFETPAMYARYHSKVTRSYALDALLQAEAKGDFRASDADELLMDLRKSNPQRFKAVGLGDDLRINDSGIVGGALVLGDRLVHLAAFRANGLRADRARDVAEQPGTNPAEQRIVQRLEWLHRMRRWFRND